MKNIFSIISFIFIGVLIYFIIKVDLFSTNILLISSAILSILLLISLVLISRKNKIIITIGIIINIIISIISLVGIYYLSSTDRFLTNSFNKKIYNQQTYYIITSKENNLEKKDIKEEVIYYKTLPDLAKKNIKNKYKVNLIEKDNLDEMFKFIKDKNNKFMYIDKGIYEIVFNINKDLIKEEYKILDTINIKTLIKKANTKQQSFNIYIGGLDFTNTNMDFNMIATINLKTNEVLLTSIPRDYYVDVAGKNGKDTLSYMGAYGLNTSVASLEKLFNTKIDYFIKVNTNSLVELVDKIGGITYCSDISYTTTHALVRNTYNDRGRKLLVKKGCQTLNGIETLAVSRERNAFSGRDRVRQENNRKIILAIFNKLNTTESITNYNSLLDSFSNLYETSISRETISKIAKKTVDNKGKWKIIEQNVDGTDTKDYVHLTNYKDWVMKPDYSTVEKASSNIDKILKNK